MVLLEVKKLNVVEIESKKNIIENINFKLERNRCLGIVGESGSGKSVTCKTILGLLSSKLKVSGEAIFRGKNILKMSRNELREIRGERICMIIQDAMGAFDPLYTLGYQISETLKENLGYSIKESNDIAINILKKIGIEKADIVLKKYPHELSGGMLQRCMIAIALAMKPDIIIADEPTTALDSINQFEIIEELRYLKESGSTSIIFISHDLGVVQKLADDILVMKDGRCLEYDQAEIIFNNPKNEYTKYLIETRLNLTKTFSKLMESV